VLFVFLKSMTGPPRYFGAVVRGSGRQVTDAEIEAAKLEHLAAWEQKRASKAPKKNPRSSPRPTGNVGRTLAARSTIQDARQQPAVVPTRLAKCSGCGFRTEVPAKDDATGTCPRCLRGDI